MTGIYTNGYTVEFGHALLRLLSAPDTADNHFFLAAWSGAEGGPAKNNPFNTGQTEPGSTPFNVDVNNYPDLQTGLKATFDNLMSTTFDYSGIVQSLRYGNSANACAAALTPTPWGTHGGAANLIAGDGNMLPQPPLGTPLIAVGPKPAAPLPGTDGGHVPQWCHQVALYKPPLPAPQTGLKITPINPGTYSAVWDVTAGATQWAWHYSNSRLGSQFHTLSTNHGRILGVRPGEKFILTITPQNSAGNGLSQTVSVYA